MAQHATDMLLKHTYNTIQYKKEKSEKKNACGVSITWNNCGLCPTFMSSGVSLL